MEFYEIVKTTGALSGLICLTLALLAFKKLLKARLLSF